MQSATPSISRKGPGSMAPLLPVMPMAVRPAPLIGCGVKPSSRTRPSMAACASAETSGWSTISMGPNISCSEAKTRLWPQAGEEGPGRKALLALELHFEKAPDGVLAAGDVESGEDFARGAAVRCLQGLREVDLQRLTRKRCPRARPGSEAAPARVQLEGALAEVRAAVLAAEQRRQRRAGVVLRDSRQLLQARQRFEQRLGAERSELRQER